MKLRTLRSSTLTAALIVPVCVASCSSDPRRDPPVAAADEEALTAAASLAALYRAPAGDRPTTRDTIIDGVHAAILPNGRLLTPAGVEISVGAPKPFGLAATPDGNTLATINSGTTPFSITLIRNARSATPDVKRIDVDATFLGIAFSPDGARFYASGGDDGTLWIGDVATAAIVGAVNLNGDAHPLDRPLDPKTTPAKRFKGAFPGALVVSPDGRWLYVVDQAGFQVHVVDTTKIALGTDASGMIVEPDNFAAVTARIPVGRYPFGIALAPGARTLYVSNVGLFQYTHLRPTEPTGDKNRDYPLCIPVLGYPDDIGTKTVTISKVDPQSLPVTLRDPNGIRCGYVDADRPYTVPGLGDPNAPEASSVYAIDVADPAHPSVRHVAKSGIAVGEVERGIAAYGGSHPNAVAVSESAVYVANGNNDSISVFEPRTLRRIGDISLAVLPGFDRRLKGVQPVALALSPDRKRLYVAEAGLNAIAVVRLGGAGGLVEGLVPVGAWPSAVRVSADGKTLIVANAKGRGAGPNDDAPPNNLGSPKSATLGSVSIVDAPAPFTLARSTARVLANDGLVPHAPAFDPKSPIPSWFGFPSARIKHVVFINKENATHDLLLGDLTATRKGEAIDGEPRYSLGRDASPNHHEIALSFTVGDNFNLEPSVSSDGHRWLTNTYTTELEETHWPASYGGKRRDSGDDPAVFLPYPGRIGFTDADGSPDPNDFDQHGGIYMHLVRNGKSFVNFGNGFEFALVDEDPGTEPTGIREHANVPMETVVRDRTDPLYPEFNTAIPDAPLPEEPARFNRFGRFKQVFESTYVDRARDACTLPSYVDLYYPNDHGGGARDIHPNGPDWSFKRFVQDNDAALGRTLDLISHSPCWRDTVVFVVEDDTQNGFDHVDGHRSIFLAASPWVKREHVAHGHYSLSSIFKTVDLVLGIPPLNQYDAAATDLRDIFTDAPDFTPYDYVPVPFETAPNPVWTKLTANIDFHAMDADEVHLRAAIAASEGLPRAKARRPVGR